MQGIRALSGNLNRNEAQWAFVDLGFSARAKSCGVLLDDAAPTELTFGGMVECISALSQSSGAPLALVLEAPLSVSFNSAGNPEARQFEKRDGQSRCWYFGLACAITTSALYLLRSLHESRPKRPILLLEGFVSFKPKGVKSSHAADVKALRAVAWGESESGYIVAPDNIASNPGNRVQSAFLASGLDFGVPPVVVSVG
ncbi:MAG: hypothetical protein ACYC9L_16275 [Sulfuricaulis sp.]